MQNWELSIGEANRNVLPGLKIRERLCGGKNLRQDSRSGFRWPLVIPEIFASWE